MTFLTLIFLVKMKKIIIWKNQVFFRLHLKVPAHCSLKLTNINGKKYWLFLTIFSSLVSKMIDVRKQANVLFVRVVSLSFYSHFQVFYSKIVITLTSCCITFHDVTKLSSTHLFPDHTVSAVNFVFTFLSIDF